MAIDLGMFSENRHEQVIVMLAMPLTLLGVMPGFLLLNTMLSVPVGGYGTLRQLP